ncbi:MAG: type II toxin-antitoxin system VapC family toxin [Egibacteraceae bacterium]
MTVVDASAVIELLLGRPPGAGVREPLQRREQLAAPHLLDAEVGQVLRRYERRGELPERRARVALAHLAALPITRFPHAPFMDRAFDLRANATVYDALYVALAEALRAPLLTADAALRHLPGSTARVELLSNSSR